MCFNKSFLIKQIKHQKVWVKIPILNSILFTYNDEGESVKPN